MYIVRAGRLEVVDESAVNVIRELGRGDPLGELALLTDSPRSASVRAARPTDVIAIDRAEFTALLETAPALSLELNRSLGRQLRESRGAVPTTRPRPATVAVVAFDERVPRRRLCAQLAHAVGRYASITVLSGDEVPVPGRDAEPATVFGPLLDRAEAAHEVVLLDAGLGRRGNFWTRFCLQQADRILVLTGGGPVPEGLDDRAELRRCDLVAFDAAPSALAGWAAALDPIESHVVREGELDGDLARAARRLTGRSLGIVLSGGGARAFSHIGVLEELADAGITIDRVAGVSMGAVIGALYAMGLDADQIDAICFEEWVQRRPLSDYTLPRRSLIRGERFRSMLHRTFGNRLIEELPRGFISGCTELRSGRLVLARHGPLWEAVGFSICLPILAPPQVRGREMFIDGSLVDNLPVRALADMGEGPIIAVDVKADFEGNPGNGLREYDGDGDRRARVPSLGETLTRVLLLGSENTSEAARRHADLVIKPSTAGIGLLEFHQLDAAREAGRAAARDALKQLPDGLASD
jgi:predicted acylesterase/phospholipase RssA